MSIFNQSIRIPDSIPVSQPYWLKNPMKAGYFDVRDQEMIGKAEGDAPFNARFVVNIEGQDFTIFRPVLQKYTDPVKGELYEPVVVVPPVLLTPVQNLFISHDNDAKDIHYTVKALEPGVKTGGFSREKPVLGNHAAACREGYSCQRKRDRLQSHGETNAG